MPNFSPEECNLLYQLAAELTGTHQEGASRHDVILNNVRRRIRATRVPSLVKYLKMVERSESEFAQLISALTIHTTSWFREPAHYKKLEEFLLHEGSKFNGANKFRLLSAAASTGQELYSFALLMEGIRSRIPAFEYQLVGHDVDSISIKKAQQGIYPLEEVSTIPSAYHRYLMAGSGASQNLFTLQKNIRQRCSFTTQSLTQPPMDQSKFHIIVCRNVLIYFSPEEIDKIIRSLLDRLAPDGMLCLGHSEAINPKPFHLRSLGNAFYQKIQEHESLAGREAGRKRILVVDDSTTVRRTVTSILNGSEYEFGEAASAEEATEYLKKNTVDLVTLDLHMPGMDGQTWLRTQRATGFRVPVVILSGASPDEAMSVLGALENGAQDYLDKSVLRNNKQELLERFRALIEGGRNRSNRQNNRQSDRISETLPRPDLIVVGASTGGTEVLSSMLKKMPKNSPPILIAQHITPTFTKAFAQRLSEISGLPLAEPIDGLRLEPGKLYMPQGDHHIGIKQRNGVLYLIVSDSPPMNRHRPSVDFLFQSAAVLTHKKIFGVLLTGMGNDGAAGLMELKSRGATTFCQDEASCIVFGMPKEAIKLGAARFIMTPESIRTSIDSACRASTNNSKVSS